MERVFISQGFRVGDLVITSGQAAVDDDGSIVGVGDFEAQGRRAIENLQRVLRAAGTDLDRLVKVTIYATDLSPENFEIVKRLRQEYFTHPYPADTLCAVAALAYPELLFEIEGTALADGDTLDVSPTSSG